MTCMDGQNDSRRQTETASRQTGECPTVWGNYPNVYRTILKYYLMAKRYMKGTLAISVIKIISKLMAFENQPLFFTVNLTWAALSVPTWFTFCLQISWAWPDVAFPRHTSLHAGCPSMACQERALERQAGSYLSMFQVSASLTFVKANHVVKPEVQGKYIVLSEPKGTRGILGLIQKIWRIWLYVHHPDM